ncbi:MAG: hypothetical protein GY716_17550 [bacterium]|nr:hypothetical protein [bacterium]
MRRAAWTLVAVLWAAAPAVADFDVAGKFEYEDREFDITGFTGVVTNLPIRFCDVEVVDVSGGGNTVLAQTATDGSGAFSVTGVVAAAPLDVEVRCIASSNQTPDLDIAVLDNPLDPDNGALWTIAVTYIAHDPVTDIDFSGAPAVAPIHSTTSNPNPGDGAGGAFNIFDRMLDGVDFVKGVNGGTGPALISGYWEPGEDTGGSYFEPDTDRLFIQGDDATRDEYDDAVVCHEVGHGVEDSLWQNRSPGGEHFFSGHYDPRLALSEGFANYFSSAVRDEGFYIDTVAGGFFGDRSLETGGRFTYNAFGSDNEISVEMLLWDIADSNDDDDDCLSMGHDEIFDVFVNYMNDSSLAKTIEDFDDGWDTQNHPMATELKQLMNSRLMEFVDNPQTKTFVNDFVDIAIPDNDAGGITRSIVVSDDFTLSSIPDDSLKQQSFSVAAYVELDHDQAHSNLQIKLKHPDGTEVTLFDQGSGGDSNSNGGNFTRDGVYAWFGWTTSPLELTAQAWLHPIPDDAMTGFDGKNLNGTWQLTVSDLVAGDTGTFRAWRLMVVSADWYDAPDSYGTDVWHRNTSYEWLGAEVSHEGGANDTHDTDPQDNQDPDDTDGKDDGITFTADVIAGEPVNVDVEVTTVGVKAARFLDEDELGRRDLVIRGWIDFDQDGTFQDPDERAIDSTTSPADWNVCEDSRTLSLTGLAPEDAIGGKTWARFRLTYEDAPGPTGIADFGEVEDYEITYGNVKISFYGTAEGGTVQVEINGVLLSINTLPGQSAETVATNLANAINNNTTLQGHGVTATTNGGMVLVNGTVSDVVVDDEGLTHDQGCKADDGASGGSLTLASSVERLIDRYELESGREELAQAVARNVERYRVKSKTQQRELAGKGRGRRANRVQGPTTNLQATIGGGSLNVTGTGGADRIELRLVNGDPTRLEVEDLTTGFVFPTFDVSDITNQIVVATLAGDDLIFFNDAFGDAAEVPPNGFNIDSGDGENTVVAGSNGLPLATVMNIFVTLQNATSLLTTADLLIAQAGAVDPLGDSGNNAITESFKLADSAQADVVLPTTAYLEDVHGELIEPSANLVLAAADPAAGGDVYDALQLVEDAYNGLVIDAYCAAGSICGPDTLPHQFDTNNQALKLAAEAFEDDARDFELLAQEFDTGGTRCIAHHEAVRDRFRNRLEILRSRLEPIIEVCWEDDEDPADIPKDANPPIDTTLPSWCPDGGRWDAPFAVDEGTRVDVVDLRANVDSFPVQALSLQECETHIQALIDCMETEILRFEALGLQCEGEANGLLDDADDLETVAGTLSAAGTQLDGLGDALLTDADNFYDQDAEPYATALDGAWAAAESDMSSRGLNMSNRGESEIDSPGQTLDTDATNTFGPLTTSMGNTETTLAGDVTTLVANTADLLEPPAFQLRGEVGAGCQFTTKNVIAGSSLFILGSMGDDLIFGTPGVNVIIGRGGNDRIFGEAGLDVILGGSGVNEIHGENGIDILIGGNEKDCMFGDKKIDVMFGRGGADEMEGGDNTDVMLGGAGDDLMRGSPGLDVMLGGADDDSIYGEGCIDVLLGGDGADTMHGGPGQTLSVGTVSIDLGDVMFGQPGGDRMVGDRDAGLGDGIDMMFGGAGDDTMSGSNGGLLKVGQNFEFKLGNVMFGGGDNDSMTSRDGVDVMFGGPGNDTMSAGDGEVLSLSNGNFTLDLGDLMFGQGEDDVMFGDDVGGTGLDVMFGGPGNDSMTGSHGGRLHTNSFDFDFGNLMFGQAGNDTMSSRDGIDLMFGGIGDDSMAAGDGFEIVLSSGNFRLDFGDLMFGSGGNDTMHGDALSDPDTAATALDGIDLLFAGDGWDEVYGGGGGTIDANGFDMIFGNLFFGSEGDDKMYGRYASPTNDEQEGMDLMFGGIGNDSLVGSGFTDIEIGNPVVLKVEFGDLIFGSAGDDTLEGSDGFDLMLGGTGNDSMVGGDGNDSIAGDGIDLMFGASGIDVMSGGHGGQIWVKINGVLSPIPFGNLMFGGGDRDIMDSKGRILDIDVLFGNDCHDDVSAGPGLVDLVFGNLGDDSLLGENGIDLIIGNRGNDTINGGEGILDLMFANAGDDEMAGDSTSSTDFPLLSINLFFGNDHDDHITGSDALIDVAFGNTGDDTIDAEGGALNVVFGNSGSDDLSTDSGVLSIGVVFGNSEPDVIDGGGGGIEVLFGNDGEDEIDAGGGLIDVVFGNSQRDEIRGGGGGLDLLFGNDSADRIEGEGGLVDLIFGNDGADKLAGGSGFDLIFGNQKDDAIDGGSDPDLLFGNGGADWIEAGSGLDLSFGNTGNDSLFGQSGLDLVFGNDNDDHVRGGSSSGVLDLLFGNLGNDTLFGEADRDWMFGNRDNDLMVGNQDASTADNVKDWMFGNRGNDTMYKCPSPKDRTWGGGGSDTKDSGCTTITVSAPACGSLRGRKTDNFGQAMEGVTIYLDGSGPTNDQLDPLEPFTKTDASGYYTFAGLPPATYEVREFEPPGYSQLAPLQHTRTITAGEGFTGLNFSNEDDCGPTPDGLACEACDCDGTVSPVFKDVCDTDGSECTSNNDCPCDGVCQLRVVDCLCLTTEPELTSSDDCWTCSSDLTFQIVDGDGALGLAIAQVLQPPGQTDVEDMLAIVPVGGDVYEVVLPATCQTTPQDNNGVLDVRPGNLVRVVYFDPPHAPQEILLSECPPLEAKTVFVTSTTYNADLDGVAGADAICVERAAAGGLSGTYKAWISDQTNGPAATFTQSSMPYARVDGALVAADWSDLTDGTLAAPIVVDEFGATQPSGIVWSGTLPDGTALGNPLCATAAGPWNRSMTQKGSLGHTGDAGAVDGAWSDSGTSGCGGPARLYCVEQ